MSGRLQGKRIVLTGVSRGVGLHAARLFLDEGAEVLGVMRPSERAERASGELEQRGQGRYRSVLVELSGAEPARVVGAAVDERWGALDVLVNNAGIQRGTTPELTDEDDTVIAEHLEIHFWVPLRLTRALLPALLRGSEPRVLHVGSGAGTFDGMQEPAIAAYRLSKWTEHGLVMLQAKELRGRVHVSGFDPGWLKTDLGGPNAPGEPEDGARGLLQSLLLPFEASGKFYKDGQVIPW